MNQIVTVNGWVLDLLDGEQERRIGAHQQGERLGYVEPRAFKKLVQRNRKELLRYGALPQRDTVSRYESRPGVWQERIVKEPMLNEAQALLMCMFANTNKAADIREEIVRVYLVVKNGSSAEVQALHSKFIVLQNQHLDLLRRIGARGHDLLGDDAAEMLSRIRELRDAMMSAGEPGSVRSVQRIADNRVRYEVGYPAGAWHECPSDKANAAHSYISRELRAIDRKAKRRAKSARLASQSTIDFEAAKRKRTEGK